MSGGYEMKDFIYIFILIYTISFAFIFMAFNATINDTIRYFDECLSNKNTFGKIWVWLGIITLTPSILCGFVIAVFGSLIIHICDRIGSKKNTEAEDLYTDFYLREDTSYMRLEEEYKKYGKLIICVDFDDTLYDFHKLGRRYNLMIKLLQRWRKYSEIYLFTGKGEDEYSAIQEYMETNNIPYDGINCDSSVISGSFKTYANVYFDDRAGLRQVYLDMYKLIDKIEKGDVVYERK